MFTNLRDELNRKGISVKAVAGLTGCNEKTIRNKLNGETEFTLNEIMAISENLFPEFRIDYLFKRDSKHCETN